MFLFVSGTVPTSFFHLCFNFYDENGDEPVEDIPGFTLIVCFAAAAYNLFKSISKLIATNGIHHMFLGRDIDVVSSNLDQGEVYNIM